MKFNLIQVAYKSKHNLTRENQVTLLTISNGENWHYLVVKNLPGSLKEITSNHKEHFLFKLFSLVQNKK